MATSVRDTAATCLGVAPPFSVRADLFGYIWGATTRDLRVASHLTLIKGKAFNLSLILVAHEEDMSGEWTLAECGRIQEAVDRMRELYAQVTVGVRELYWQYIPIADAGGYTVVDGGEATDLTEDWTGANDGIDVFLVNSVTDADGWSNTDGPCDKNSKGRTGVVMEVYNNADLAGILMAHEVGHYLHLQHASNITNVMGDDSDGDGVGSIDSTSTNLTAAQGTTMKGSCFIRPNC